MNNLQKSVIIPRERFYEGGSSSLLTHQVKKCVQSGISAGLAALDSTATPAMTAIWPRRWLMSAHK
ncbi:hypothetical protein DMH88_18725 [Escherichia coli]|nr:hypothetical protein [Escherichia coli]